MAELRPTGLTVSVVEANAAGTAYAAGRGAAAGGIIALGKYPSPLTCQKQLKITPNLHFTRSQLPELVFNLAVTIAVL